MSRCDFIFRVAVLLLTSAMWVPSAGALPPAGRYPSREVALDRPSDAEEEVLRRINEERRARGLAPFAWEPILSAVAREHSEDMAKYDYLDYTSPRLGTIEYRRHRAGCPAGNLRLAIASAASAEAIVRQFSRDQEPFHLGDGTHLGVGIATRGLLRQMYATLIAADVHSVLEPFPTMPLYGKKYRLAGRIEKGFSDPRLLVALPDGQVTELGLSLSPNGEFSTLVAFDRGKGEYILEIVADGRLGPVVLNLMRCYAGVPYPEPPVESQSDSTPGDLHVAELAMLEMINRERARAGLNPLRFDERLAAVAREHSRDMLLNHFFAHVSPTRGDLAARIARAGLTESARAFTENIAANRSLREAHEGLMNSPGHRRNIMDPLAESAGIGIVRRGDDLLVTQNFARRSPDYDPDSLAREFLEAANEVRRARGLAPLVEDPTLGRFARENSSAMKRDRRAGHDRARQLLGEARFPYAVQIGILRSSEPPRPEHIAQVLEGKYRRIGIGIAQAESEPRDLWTTVLLAEQE